MSTGPATVVDMTAVMDRPEPSTTTHDPPPCECIHPMPWGDEPCGEPADYLVTILCAAEGCSDPAVYLLCAACTESLQERERRRGNLARLRILPLP